jgi:hypothetical protein
MKSWSKYISQNILSCLCSVSSECGQDVSKLNKRAKETFNNRLRAEMSLKFPGLEICLTFQRSEVRGQV